MLELAISDLMASMFYWKLHTAYFSREASKADLGAELGNFVLKLSEFHSETFLTACLFTSMFWSKW